MTKKIKFRDKIEYIDIKKLKVYEKNNKRHSEEQINLLMENIKRFGFTTPLLINNDNLIIAGHGRLEAGKKLGLKKLPIIRIDDLTEEEERLLRLADNRLTELGEWDWEAINKELEELFDLDINTEITGFELDNIEEEIFTPNYNPNIGNNEVTEDIIKKTESQLSDLSNNQNKPTSRKIICPHCLKEFEVDL